MGKKEQYCKLTDAQVRGMRSLYKQGYTITELSRMYKIAKSCVHKIVNLQTRKDV